MKKYLMSAALVLLLGGCFGSEDAGNAQNPQSVLSTVATALNNKDAKLFLEQLNMPRYVAAATDSLTRDNEPLNMLDSFSKSVGIGSIQGIVGAVSGVEGDIEEYFQRHVSTGEIVQQCTRTTTPDCPWVPTSLKNARIKELSSTAAVAGVTTPTNILSWLALAKEGDTWKVVGMAVLESDAIRYALGSQTSPPTDEKKAPEHNESAPPPPLPKTSSTPQQDEAAPPPPEKPVRL